MSLMLHDLLAFGTVLCYWNSLVSQCDMYCLCLYCLNVGHALLKTVLQMGVHPCLHACIHSCLVCLVTS